MILLFLKSALLGVIITAPLGPIGTLCINRTLEDGFWAGFSGGLGTAIGDASYALIAVAGLSMFSETVTAAKIPLGLGGGLLMLWLGYRGFSSDPRAAEIGATGFLSLTLATFFLTISNPATILSFGALFAGFGLTEDNSALSSTLIVAGVFTGSLAWWFCLSAGISLARDRLSDRFTAKVARGSSILLIVFGVLALGTVAYALV